MAHYRDLQVTQLDTMKIVNLFMTPSSEPEDSRKQLIREIVRVVDPYMTGPKEKKFYCIAKIVKIIDEEHGKHSVVSDGQPDNIVETLGGVSEDRLTCCIGFLKSEDGRLLVEYLRQQSTRVPLQKSLHALFLETLSAAWYNIIAALGWGQVP